MNMYDGEFSLDLVTSAFSISRKLPMLFFLTMSLNPSAVPPVVFIINFDHALYETEHYLLLSCF